MAWIRNLSVFARVFVLLSFVALALSSLDEGDNMKSQPAFMLLKIFEENLKLEIRNFTKTGYRSKMFEKYSEMSGTKEPENAVLGCAACRLYVASLMSDRRNGASEQQLEDSAFNMCRIATSYSVEMCRGIIRLNVEPMVYILDARPSLTAAQMCSIALQGDCGTIDASFSFSVNVNPGQPITQPKSIHSVRSANDMKIIHLTDLHYDENYVEGNNALCQNSLCCRRNDERPSNPADGAGFWGDLRDCGSPWRTIENTLRRIRSQHPDVDMIYHTGDMRDHGIWETTEVGNRRIMDRLFNMFKEVFGNIPIFHILGNHEAQPVNQFAPSVITRPTLSARWLYDYSADTWLRHGWITTAQASTIRVGGYYTTLIRPGFRIIALNNNDQYIYNWWIMYSRNDLQSELQWLHNTLLAAEQANERVHILAHIRSGSGSSFRFWSREFRRIIDRFHMIIGAQFNGHSHRVDYEVFYDSATAQHAVNVAWNAGSVGSFGGVNPNYVQYFVDRTHYQVTDFESYIFSISEANQTPAQSPRWFRQFSFSEAFGVTDFSPASLDRFTFDMSRNRNIARRYWQHRVKAADPHIQRGCNDDCLRGIVCGVVRNEHGELRRCNQVLAVFGTVA